ncbi:MAG: flagellar positioning protein PflI [Proteobacteria bacterium]|nr:flagellar positioning protein PflI [Pseudomonadota bacterium]
MSAVALILNLLLGGLLLLALGLGWRLERRLKALRESQATFVGAVQDLDRAAARAEQGLADLRAATDEAAESLAGRIAAAKTLSAKLDSSLTRAEKAAEAPRARAEVRPEARPDPRPDPRAEARADLRLEPRHDARFDARDIRNDLILEDEPARRPFEARLDAMRPRFAPPPPAATSPRSRARVDDDLFDEGAGARKAARADLGLGGRR